MDLQDKYWIAHSNEGKAHFGFTSVDWRTMNALKKEKHIETFNTQEKQQERLKELGVNIEAEALTL